MQTMPALVKRSREPGPWLEDVPVPRIGINDVLIEVLRTGICGTDVAYLQLGRLGTADDSRAEGHTVVVKGQRWLVADYEESLVSPSEFAKKPAKATKHPKQLKPRAVRQG